MPRLRLPKLEAETTVTLAGTAFSAALLILTAINAGPLWRDEVNTANVAQMPTLREMCGDSFPPLYALLLRGCSVLGLAGGDGSIRVLGLYVGFFVLGSFWLCARWMGCRAPILSIALLGCLPSFILTVGANRAYGLACGLLILSFGTIWRMVEFPSRSRILTASLACFLLAHCIYYDVVFLAAMLAGGAVVALGRRQWKTLGALAGIGIVSSVSMLIYLPLVREGSSHMSIMEWPYFTFSALWNPLGDAVTIRGSAQIGHNGPEIWLWIALLLGGVAAALIAQRTRVSRPTNPAATTVQNPADLTMFCAVSMLLGVAGLLAFMYRLHYWAQPWYFVEMLCLCAISLDGLLGAGWPRLRPWGLLRMGFMAGMMIWSVRAGWAEAHTRRSNVDLIAAVLNHNASDGDLIVMQNAWEGITFNRYYHGPARWVTVPPIESHLVHRNDLVFEKMNQPEPMVPVLSDILRTLRDGHCIWLVGNIPVMRPDPRSGQPARWFGAYLSYWNGQVSSVLLDHALHEAVLNIPAGEPVCYLENLRLIQFTGYKSEDRTAGVPPAN